MSAALVIHFNKIPTNLESISVSKIKDQNRLELTGTVVIVSVIMLEAFYIKWTFNVEDYMNSVAK